MNNERLNTMRNRIENVGLEDAGVDEGLVAEIIDELIDSRSQVTTLTAERDEARKELEDAQRQEIETIAAVINHRKLIDEQKQKIDFLTAELAALTSCPAMEEVDALVHQESLPLCERESCTDKDGVLFQRLAAIARRSIASRQEVVGLLVKCHEVFREEMNRVKDCIDLSESYRRIIEIVEGKG